MDVSKEATTNEAPKRKWQGSPENLEALRKAREKSLALNRAGAVKSGRKKGGRDGYRGPAGRRRLAHFRSEARKEAEGMVEKMLDNGIVKKDIAGNEALIELVSIVVARDAEGKPLESTKDRISAASKVLDFTMAKPETKQSVVVQTAEDFLRGLAAEDAGSDNPDD